MIDIVGFPSPMKSIFTRAKREFTMYRLLILLISIWSIVQFSLLLAKNGGPVMRNAPPPKPFFPNNSFVRDFYNGNSPLADVLMADSEFTIVMLYAPWDSRSKQFRHSFVKVAAAFHPIDSVKFIAVNCYYHKGQCRKMFKLLSYPVIYAQTQYGQPIVFNQILSSIRLFSWVQYLLSPLQRIQSIAEHRQMVLASDFLVVAHFAFQRPSPLPRAYHVFLNAAYKSADSRSSLRFGVVLNPKLALDSFHFSAPNQLHFYTFYEDEPTHLIASMDIGEETKSQDLVRWLNEHISRYNSRAVYEHEFEDLESPGKSEALFQKLNSSDATVVLFTNIVSLPQHQSGSEIALKNFAKLFHHCPSNSASKPDCSRVGELGRLFSGAREACSLKEEKFRDCCGQFGTKCLKRSEEEMSPDPFTADEGERNSECEKLNSINTLTLLKRRCCLRERKEKRNQSAGLVAVDWTHQMQCQFSRFLRKQHNHVYRELSFSRHPSSECSIDLALDWMTGAGCRLNRSIGFVVVDKQFARHFLHRWGLPSKAIDEGGDSMALVSWADERVFWMDLHTDINVQNLAKFVDDYLNNSLKWVPANERIDERVQDQDGRESEFGFLLSVLPKLNLQMFTRQILNSSRSHDAVVFFSGGEWHLPSRSVLHFFHQTRHYFREFKQFIQFYMIDTTRNSLPWQFNFERLPTVAFFPVHSPNESFAFDTAFAHSVPNLLGFILPRCQPLLQWRLAFSVCGRKCLEQNIRRIDRLVQKASTDTNLLRSMIRRAQRRQQFALALFNTRHFVNLMKRWRHLSASSKHRRLLWLLRRMKR